MLRISHRISCWQLLAENIKQIKCHKINSSKWLTTCTHSAASSRTSESRNNSVMQSSSFLINIPRSISSKTAKQRVLQGEHGHIQRHGIGDERQPFSTSSSRNVEYEQGQSPAPKLREYFYYIDHQGMLFLDDSRMKNFTSCFKDKKFLEFFFKRLRRNESDRYPQFPYVSLCGREKNYVRCDDIPIVYTQLIPSSPPDGGGPMLRYNYGDDTMVSPFLPSKVIMEPSSGRVYHPAPGAHAQRVAPVALLHTKIALHLAASFKFSDGEEAPPSHLRWQEEEVPLDYLLLQQLHDMAPIRKLSLGLGDSE